MRSAFIVILNEDIDKPFYRHKVPKELSKLGLELTDHNTAHGCNTSYLAVKSRKEVTPEVFRGLIRKGYAESRLPSVPGRENEQFIVRREYNKPETAHEVFSRDVREHRFNS